jgi:hypothetical protein
VRYAKLLFTSEEVSGMSFVFRAAELRRLELRSRGRDFTVMLEEIPATMLFELAQRFQKGRRESESEAVTIPADFARSVVDAVAETASGWEGVVDEDGSALEFDRAKLRRILESDVGLIPQLISFIAELFLEARAEEERLGGEEKN